MTTHSENSEFDDYRLEISSIVTKEKCRLDAYAQALQAEENRPGPDDVDARVIEAVLRSVEEAGRGLDKLLDMIHEESKPVAFNQLGKFAAFAIKQSIAARSSLLRHTPTLKGIPHAMDPMQNHRLNQGEHIIDYARNAYLQFQEPVAGAERRYKDNPILSNAALSMSDTLYGRRQADAFSLLYSSAMGAITSIIDSIAILSRQTGQTNVIGQRCWFEIRQYIQEHYPGLFTEIDENDTAAIVQAVNEPSILGLILEPLTNYPEMSAIDLPRIIESLRKRDKRQHKIIVFDIVHTPELDIVGDFFPDGVPGKLAIATVISGVKFMQAGWDISKSGLLSLACHPDFARIDDRSLYYKLIDIRSISGRAPSLDEALLADIETPESFRSRLSRYDRNTRYFAKSLNHWLKQHRLGFVSSPWLDDHPQHELAMQFYRTGGRILFVFFNPALIDHNDQGQLFKNLAEAASLEGISLMTAPSFGMSTPHIHIVIRPGLPTCLRISTGSTHHECVEKLLGFIKTYLGRYIAQKTKSRESLDPQ